MKSSCLSLLGLAGLAHAALFTNPIKMNMADPFMVYDDATRAYYLTGTTGNSLELISAKTLDGIRANPDRRLVYQDEFMLKHGNIWAPEIHKIDGRWYMYYSNNSFPWVVTGGENPFDTYSNPTLLSKRGGIDGTVLRLNGKRYFAWSGQISSIVISELETPTKINDEVVGTISHPTEVWEYFQGPAPNGINEAPQALYWNGETYLMYSGSGCGTGDYALGILHYTGGDPLSNESWSKHPDPVFHSGSGIFGPGHNGIFTSPDGSQLWNIYHAVQDPKGDCGPSRAVYAKEVNTSIFDVDSGPDFGKPARVGIIYPGPSGEPEWPESINGIRPAHCDSCWLRPGGQGDEASLVFQSGA